MLDRQIALVFDFDGTVAPDVMLSPVFDMLGIKPTLFWEKTGSLTEEGYEREISYLQALVLACSDKGIPLTNATIRNLGARFQFYHGFPDILRRLKKTSTDNGHELGIYVMTAGLEELVLGSQLGPYLTRCWGCGFAEEPTGVISHPKRIVTSANKVEILYLIKRQLLEHGDTYRVNLVEPKEYLVPWNKVIYFVDGATDVPAFEVVRRGGGFTLAVYDPDKGPNESTMVSGRTHLMVEGDYRHGSPLDMALTSAIITASNI